MKDYRNITARKWHIICYDKKVVDAIIGKATRWAYILHDRDVYTDTTEHHKAGQLKPPHYHVYVYRRNDTKGEYFIKLGALASPENPTARVAVQTEASDAILYFQHKTEEAIVEKKTPYDRTEITFDKDDDHYLTFAEAEQKREKVRIEARQDKEADNLTLLEDLILHHDNPVYMFKTYGRFYATSKRHLEEFRNDILFAPDDTLSELSEEARERIRSEKPVSTVENLDYDLDLGAMVYELQRMEQETRDLLLSKHPDRIQAVSQLVADRITLSETIRAYCDIKRIPNPETPRGAKYREDSINAYLSTLEQKDN